MSYSIQQAMQTALPKLTIDRKLVERINRYQVGFVSKNPEHLAFFGGNLTGVHTVRMTESDKDRFYEEVLNIDSIMLEEEIAKVDTINQDFIVSSDPLNITLVYLAHRFLASDLDDKTKIRGAMDAMLVLNYKILTSILSWFFKYPADQKVAEATYAALNYKFIIKKEGSWGRALERRSRDIIDPDGIHYDRFIQFKDDNETVYLINDIAGRLKDIMKNIYSVFMEVHATGEVIASTSSTGLDAEGVEIFKDKVNGLENYVNYAKQVVIDRDSFIKDALFSVVVRMMHTIQPKAFMKTLEYLCVNFSDKKHAYLEELISVTIVHSYNYIGEYSSNVNTKMELPKFLAILRGGYMSSRSVDEDLMKMRELGHRLVKEATHSTNEGAIAAARTGVFLYIVLRTYTKHHYG
jgi:hypothetical protein